MADIPQNDASTSHPSPATPPTFNVELKKTKVIWAQPALAAPLTWTETMMDLVAFRTMLDGRTAEDGPLSSIPDEHLPLIGKLVQESEKDLKTLTSEIHTTLSPDAALPTKAVSAAVDQVANRVNYGIDGGLKDFCVWRWEIENLDHIPTRLRVSMLQRREDRERGRAVLSTLYNALPAADRTSILTKSKQKKLEASSGGKENIPAPTPVPRTTTSSTIDLTSPEPSTQSALDVKPLAPLEVKPKEVKAKEKEAKPKKSASGTTKASKEAATSAPGKSNLLGWLNPKAKAVVASSSKADVVMEDTKPEPAKPTFDELFLPFRVKKGTTLAPINYFDQDVIVIEPSVSKRQGKSSLKDINFLETFKASIPASSKPRATTYPRLHPSAPPLRTTSKISVRDLVDQLNDATMAGDVNGAKALISTLSDRKKLPLRWFHFWDNTRPMWVGTWTKTARNVGPRTPFGKEDGVDYEYDSGEDWVEEEEGEEMEDTETADGEDEEEEEEDNRDWIVDDDDEELEQEDEGHILSLDEIGSGIIALPSSKGKRKADGLHGWSSKSGNKRRRLVPLKPDCKGPLWESKIGHTQISSWSRYSIRVLNDTPLLIDPLVPYGDSPTTDKAKGPDGFVVPAVPGRFLGSSKPTASSRSGSPSQTITKRASGPGAKTVALLPDSLMQKMAVLVLDAPIGTTQLSLVDRVYQALKGEGAKKNAVDATLKAVFEKLKGEKRWVIREEYRGSVGVTTSEPS